MKETMPKHISPEQVRRKVDLISVDPETKNYKIVASCLLEGGRVKITGEQRFVEQLKHGVKSYPDQRVILPESGEEFLKGLERQYRSAYLFAEESEDEASAS